MSDTVENNCFDALLRNEFDYSYRNCIITTNSDSSDTDDVAPSTSRSGSTSFTMFDDSGLNVDALKVVKLEPDDLFALLLGLMIKIKKYLKESDNVLCKKWLINQMSLMETALISHADMFQNEISFINGECYFLTKNQETCESLTEEIQETNDHNGECEELSNCEQSADFHNKQNKRLSENTSDQKGKYEKLSSSKHQNHRHTNRIHDQKEKTVLHDGVPYVSSKLLTCTSTPNPTKNQETHEPQTEKRQETKDHKGKSKELNNSKQCTTSPNKQIRRRSEKISSQKRKYKKLNFSEKHPQTRRHSDRIYDQKDRTIKCDRLTSISMKFQTPSTLKSEIAPNNTKATVKKLQKARKTLNGIGNNKTTKLNKKKQMNESSGQVEEVNKQKLSQQKAENNEASTSKEYSREGNGRLSKKDQKVDLLSSPIDKKSDSRKRRAKSLDNCQSKKAKTNEAQNITVPTIQNLSLLNHTRKSRKLYSPEAWLHALKEKIDEAKKMP